MLKIYMIDEVENVQEFDSLEDAKEFVRKTEPAIINYSVFYRAPADLYVTTRIAVEGKLIGYEYQILNQ